MPEQTSPLGDDFPCCTAPAARAELSREYLDVFTSDPHAAAESEVKAMARELLAARARVAELEAQAERVRQVHQPIDALNMRHHPNGRLARVCSGCGTDDGNWQLYPCPTIRAGDVPTHPRTPKGAR